MVDINDGEIKKRSHKQLSWAGEWTCVWRRFKTSSGVLIKSADWQPGRLARHRRFIKRTPTFFPQRSSRVGGHILAHGVQARARARTHTRTWLSDNKTAVTVQRWPPLNRQPPAQIHIPVTEHQSATGRQLLAWTRAPSALMNNNEKKNSLEYE